MIQLRRFTAPLLTLFLVVLCHLLIGVTALPLWLRTIAVMGITLGLPGYWLTRALLRETPRTLQARLEWVVLSVGSGYVLQVLGMTLLSYMAGGITPFQTYATFYGLIFLLMGISLLFPPQVTATPQNTALSPTPDRYITGMVVVVLLVAGFFRFTNLGYSEFQGDEARAVLRAAAILQGHEETLFLHRKGPAEIVITAIGYSLTGLLDESAARLPFALAGVLIPLTIFVIGWRLHSPLVGMVAGILMAIEGHFIGYGRIVQYHTIADLMSALVILMGCRLIDRPIQIARALILTALFTATGLLSHYEVLQIGVPLLFVLWVIWRQGTEIRTVMGATTLAMVVGVVSLAIFYVPFVLSPNFGNIADYLAENLFEGEGSAPYNHLSFIFRTATFYSTTYFVVLVTTLVIGALVAKYTQHRRKIVIVVGILLLGMGVLGAAGVGIIRAGNTDFTILWWTLAFALLWSSSLSFTERLIWLWFIVKLTVVAFLTARPALHYIPTLMPMVLLAGLMLVQLYEWLRNRFNVPTVRIGATITGAVFVSVVSFFLYRNFIVNEIEYLREWDWQAEYAWTLNTEKEAIPIFGMPHQSGWKAVGMLYAMGLLDGTYDTNTRDWIAEWYTREALRCERIHTYFFLETNELPWTLDPVRERLVQEFHQIGTITVNGDPRLEVYQAGAATNAPLWTVETSDYTLSFDTTSTYVGLDLDTPVIDPNPAYDAVIQAEDHLWIEGYDLDRVEAAAGEALRVTLYWRVRERMDEDLTITTEVIGNDGEIEGEVNREPGCYTRPTSGWSQDRLVVDHYDIPLFDDAVEGFYMLGASLYDEQSGEFWDFYDEDGALIGDVLDLGDVQIEK